MKDVKWIFQNAWVFKIHFSFWCFANFSFISFFVVSIYVSASMFSKLKNTDNWKFYFRKLVHPTNFWDWTRKQGGCPISGTTFHLLGWRKYRFSESFLTVGRIVNFESRNGRNRCKSTNWSQNETKFTDCRMSKMGLESCLNFESLTPWSRVATPRAKDTSNYI